MRRALLAIVLGVIAPPAFAQTPLPENSYIGGFGGASSAIDGTVSFGPILGLSFGVETARGPIEIEIAQRNRSVTGPDGTTEGDESVTSFMANGYYRLPSFGNDRITPYVGGGIGLATGFDVPGTTDTDSATLAAQAMAGVEYSLGGATSLTGEVRYFVTDTFDVEVPVGTADWQIESLDVVVGLRLRF